MSTLIIGVLFVVALVAIIALVFVLRSEPRSTGTVPENPAASATPDVATTSEPDTATTTNGSLPSMTSVPTVPDVPSVPTATEESHLAMGNGQFHELAVELHTLHGQSQEIEHRLSILSEMIERIERSQEAHITEEYSSLVDRQSAN